MDVKVVVWEDDTGWGGGQEPVSTHYFTDILLSEDVDGQDYYEKAAPDAEGGSNLLRVSSNGFTAQIGKTRLVTFGFDKAFIDDNRECCGYNGEMQFTLLAGRAGYQTTVYRGDPGSNTHYSRQDDTWVDIGVHAKNNGAVESETILRIRMLTAATARFDLTMWEDDGGWSARDGGNTYTTQSVVSSLVAGRKNYTGTAHADWDGYWYIVADA